MRLNKYIAQASGISRRQADELIAAGRVLVNSQVATFNTVFNETDSVMVDGEVISEQPMVYVLLNKPPGYVCSRKQQDDKPTIYSLLPENYHQLKVVGRLDADSRGLLLLTNDGDFAHQLTHPKFAKRKLYEVELDRALLDVDLHRIRSGVEIDETGRPSILELDGTGNNWQVTLTEGRNRQIRRTFEALGYTVADLRRTHFGNYEIGELAEGDYALTEKKVS